MIESLKEEQRNELDEIEDEYNEKIQTFQRNFKTNEFKTNPALLLLEEQFRLSMCNKINDLILLTKNKIKFNYELFMYNK